MRIHTSGHGDWQRMRLVDLLAIDWAIMELALGLYGTIYAGTKHDCAFKHGLEKPYPGVQACARSNLQYTKTWLTHLKSSIAVEDLSRCVCERLLRFRYLSYPLVIEKHYYACTFTLSSPCEYWLYKKSFISQSFASWQLRYAQISPPRPRSSSWATDSRLSTDTGVGRLLIQAAIPSCIMMSRRTLPSISDSVYPRGRMNIRWI
ncbi:hypothetical protein EDD22DRAFT_255829 [Suillus occidentalis]|nr:hypothetical protein EDD22DRAFT_255829 [Suillus occidentalis]